MKMLNSFMKMLVQLMLKSKSIRFSKDLKINYDFFNFISLELATKMIIQGYSVTEKNVPHCWDGESNIIQFKNV